MARPRKNTAVEETNSYQDVQSQQYGIYAYIRKSDNKIVYVGKDSNIHHRKRHSLHVNPAGKWQRINEELKKDPKAYYYQVVAVVADQDWMEDIEASLIEQFKFAGQCEFNIADEVNTDG